MQGTHIVYAIIAGIVRNLKH